MLNRRGLLSCAKVIAISGIGGKDKPLAVPARS
jgi:hypothetical protein